MVYLVYIFVISHLDRGYTKKALSRLKNDWILLAADSITALLWFLSGLLSLNIFAISAWSDYSTF